jgi:hypothetical protein
MFLRKTSRNRPSTSDPHPRARKNPRGLPQIQQARSPWTRTPSNEAFVLSLLEGYGADEAEAMETEPAPRADDWRAKYLTWMD